MDEYCAYIYNATKRLYLTSQVEKSFGFGEKPDDRIRFYDETDAENTLELLEEMLSDCFVLVKENTHQTVYAVVMEWEHEAERGTDIELFDNLEGAEKYFDRLVEKEQRDSWIGDVAELVEECEPHYYGAYDDGSEAKTHTYIRIIEKELNKEL